MSTFSLIVKIADQDPVKHNLEADTITFGRGPDNGIQVLVAEVSVAHGEFVKSGDTYKIVDKGSSNGTKVNGRPTNPDGTKLAPMDKIILGATTPVYFVPAAVADSGSLEELIAGIEAAPKGASPAAPGAPAAPAAVASPAAPAKPLPVKPAAVQPAAAKPAPVAGASTVKLAQVQTPKPGAPAPLKPPGAAPAAPAAPKVAGGSPAPAPLAPKPGGPPAPAPAKPAGGAVPAPVPLKKAEPKAPSIPLPPKKPGAE